MGDRGRARRSDRRGINLVGLIVIVLAMVGIGVALSTLARQAGRSGHWFYHSQIAHDVADAALKYAFYQLSQANSPPAAAAAGPMAGVLRQVYGALTTTSGGGEFTLIDSDGGPMPAGLNQLLTRLAAYGVSVTVRLKIGSSQDLFPGPIQGLPKMNGEKRGLVTITARAAVKTPTGIPLERTIALEKEFKVICPLPPLFGRFSLYALERGTEDPNTIPMTYDHTDGNATLGAPRPLVLKSKAAPALVPPGSNRLDRQTFASGLPPNFVDEQGWVYLGGTSATPWKLRLAHGFGDGGESPLLPGIRPNAPTLFRGSQREDDAFKSRLRRSWQTNLTGCYPHWSLPVPTGLFHFYHGFAQDYATISIQAPLHQSARTRMNLGDGKTSCLRLFGNPSEMSPTLVFGPVFRMTLRRTSILTYMDALGGCLQRGYRNFQLWNLDQHSPPVRRVFQDAFQQDNAAWGTGVREDEPFVAGLGVVLNAQGGGDYQPDGSLFPTGPPGSGGAPPAFTSALVPWLSPLLTNTGTPSTVVLSPDRMGRLVRGELASPQVFDGNLKDGLGAFIEVLKKKITFEVTRAAFDQRMVVTGVAGVTLKVPGVVRVRTTGELPIPKIDAVEGGILIADGPIRIRGNIARGAPTEPLTLVSARGDITIDGTATRIEAVLIALDGQVKFSGDVEISGGIACKQLDVRGLSQAGNRKIVHAPETDPLGPNKTLLKVYYGGQDRVMVAGGGG